MSAVPPRSNVSHFCTVYPQFEKYIRVAEDLPISTRSLLIKLCQAQTIPPPYTTLGKLLDTLPPHITLRGRYQRPISIRDLLIETGFDPSDPLDSAILLDISRGVSASDTDISTTKNQSWGKEIKLAQGTYRDIPVDWRAIFHPDPRYRLNRIHPMLPPNRPMCSFIHLKLRRLREKIRGTTLYSRYTHKNISKDTRRQYEQVFKDDLDGVQILGQDDVLRKYHETGIFIEGDTEMRQKWYPSGAKPRTYFAMGGNAFKHSRFLQDFFTQLVDSLPMSHHKSRLRPGRLVLPLPEDEDQTFHWFIYDLSSFTSNCCIQRSLCYALSGFFEGVEVCLMDEREGPVWQDLGSLLYQYTLHCVENPPLSIERFDPSLMGVTLLHEVASMLGIFGNLMSCTFGHTSIVSQISSNPDNTNCAGDDGLVPTSLETEGIVDSAIQIVGSYEREKTFRGEEEATICLKRPFEETYPHPTLLNNIVPPTVITALLVFGQTDLRFSTYEDYNSWSKEDRITVIGKDLIRTLRSAWRLGYKDVGRLSAMVYGFAKLVKRLLGVWPKPSAGNGSYMWPLDPADYEFESADPLYILFVYLSPVPREIDLREVVPSYPDTFSSGDTFRSNSCKFLKLFEMLGYLQKEAVRIPLDPSRILLHYTNLVSSAFVPTVYQYRVIHDIPPQFVDPNKII